MTQPTPPTDTKLPDVAGKAAGQTAHAEPERAVDADYALVSLAQAGDDRAYEMLVIKYQRRIERLVGRMVRDGDIVQDIAQETFIRAWRALRNFRGDAQFYTWLYRIAVNTAKKHLMDIKRDPVVTEAALRGASSEDDETSFADHPLNNRATDGETPESAYAAKEIAEAVNSAMDALPEELRQAITLRELEGLSYEEISEMMSCPIGTVRSRIFRAREAISARIKPMLQKQTTKRW
jgi:RNA polymerase sigma-70 factor, ECF subfamily